MSEDIRNVLQLLSILCVMPLLWEMLSDIFERIIRKLN
jgi:hypothetical protein